MNADPKRMTHNHHNPVSKLIIPISVAIILVLLLVVVPAAYAEGPVVCASGAGDVAQTNYDLSTCGAPVDIPVYIVLMVKSDAISEANAQMSEGALSCNVYASLGSAADCAVTVRDGVLDNWQVANSPENYQLTASWVELTPTPNVYTSTLTSGDIFTVERRETYGEKYTNSLLFLMCFLLIVNIVVTSIRSRR